MTAPDGEPPERGVEDDFLLDIPKPSTAVLHDVGLPGPPVSPAARLGEYSPLEWETFTHECVHQLKTQYWQVKRVGGPGDRGIDIAAMRSRHKLLGPWDCYQCKHYAAPLIFSDVAPEIFKILVAVLDGFCRMPETYRFVAPKGCGLALHQLLDRPPVLKQEFLDWLMKPAQRSLPCRSEVAELAKATDFSMFMSEELIDLLDLHRQTPWHVWRFGTALRSRPTGGNAPRQIAAAETRYVAQLLAVYREHYPADDLTLDALSGDHEAVKHFQRQRESFFQAESLKKFAEEAVPPGTFERLQEDVFHGVIDTAEGSHATGMDRLRSVLERVPLLDLSRHRLIDVASLQDRKGICHQLANADRLTWVPDNSPRGGSND